jgi:hypothetical protein
LFQYTESFESGGPVRLLNRPSHTVDFLVTDGSGSSAKWAIEMEALRSFQEPWYELSTMFRDYAEPILEVANAKYASGQREADGTVLIKAADLRRPN